MARSLRVARTLAGWLVVLAAAAVLVPGLLGLERYVIVGGSMDPTIPRGALLYAEVVPVEDLVVGDIVTYVPPPRSRISYPVTHRISAINTPPEGGRVFVTTGDANPSPDPWGEFTFAGDTQARYRHHIPYAGYVFAALQLRLVRMVVIGLPAAVIALLILRQMMGDARAGSRPEPVRAAGFHRPIDV